MGLQDIAGVFSRNFIIGFFLPVFFVIFLLAWLVDPSSLPGAYTGASGTTKVFIVGGTALLVALLLSGIHVPIIRIFEGYPVRRLRVAQGRKAGPAKWLHEVLMAPTRKRYDELDRRRAIEEPSDDRTAAAQELAKFYPGRDQLLPTRFGNAIRSFEVYPRLCYGLDGVTVWPRIELLLSDGERDVLSNAPTDVAFFINAAVLLPLMGAFFITDAALTGGIAIPLWVQWIPYALPFAAAVAAYRGAITAATRWGEPVRAAFDVHRLELYKRLGVKRPTGPEEETRIADRVNRLLLYGKPLDAELRIGEDGTDER